MTYNLKIEYLNDEYSYKELEEIKKFCREYKSEESKKMIKICEELQYNIIEKIRKG